MREIDRATDIRERTQQPLPGRGGDADQLGQCHAGEPLHREVRPAVAVPRELVDGHDRGVIEPRLDPRLAQEPRVILVGRGAAHALDRDVAVDPPVMREHDLAHPTAPDHLAIGVDVVDTRLDVVRPSGVRTPTVHERLRLAVLIHHASIVQAGA